MILNESLDSLRRYICKWKKKFGPFLIFKFRVLLKSGANVLILFLEVFRKLVHCGTVHYNYKSDQNCTQPRVCFKPRSYIYRLGWKKFLKTHSYSLLITGFISQNNILPGLPYSWDFKCALLIWKSSFCQKVTVHEDRKSPS